MATVNRNDWAHTWLRIREWARIWYNTRKFTSDTAYNDQNYPTVETILKNDGCIFDSDVDQGERIGVLNQRALVAASMSSPRQFLDPLLLQLSRAMGYPQTNPLAVLPILYKYMATNQGGFAPVAPFVNSRGFTRGGWTAGGSNVGNGTVLRLNVDQYGNPIESDAPDVLNFLCSKDSNSGTNPGQEQFTVTGQPFLDNLARYTSGYSIGIGNQIPVNNLVGVSCDATQSLIQNPSFSAFSGTGGTSSFALNGWTLTSGTAASMSVSTTPTDIYRSSAIETTAGALKCTGSVTLTTTIPAGQLNAFMAYMAQIAVNRSNYPATGSVQLQIGSKSNSITLTAQSGYQLLRFNLDKNLYYANFATSGPITVTLTITVSSGTAILVDDLNFQPFQNIGGKLLWAIGGSTNWLLNDTGTITDTVPTTNGTVISVPTTGNVQTLFAEAYGWSLPNSTPGTAPTAPAAAAAAGGAGSVGVVGVVICFLTSGQLSMPSTEVSVVLSGTNNKIALTSIPLGPGGTTARYCFVTWNGVNVSDWNNTANTFTSPASQQSAYYYSSAGTLLDNVTTSVTFDPSTFFINQPLPYCGDI